MCGNQIFDLVIGGHTGQGEDRAEVAFVKFAIVEAFHRPFNFEEFFKAQGFARAVQQKWWHLVLVTQKFAEIVFVGQGPVDQTEGLAVHHRIVFGQTQKAHDVVGGKFEVAHQFEQGLGTVEADTFIGQGIIRSNYCANIDLGEGAAPRHFDQFADHAA